jgi:CRP-like cAMP-binding protein
MAFSTWRARKKYRPGIDDPPPTTTEWIAGILGLSAVMAVIAMNSRRIRDLVRRGRSTKGS